MEQFYFVILGFLIILACFDLFVGVSNDAVNFLNSAIGCRIASFRTTMWVASFGVLLGATFSSGMMEVARSGVFHPQMFTFNEIMVIFLAVMISEVFLLDTFNSLGLPTSTTVSIIFELLGTSLAAAIYKLTSAGASLVEVATFINSSKALTIISGILVSVVIAFIAGAIVQYLARIIFTFHFEAMYRRIGGIYGGFAITSIFYFLIMKGAKGSSFMRPEWIDWINANTMTILLSLFIGLSIVFQILIWLVQLNVFRIIILSGTFSLAFAFAGNDLVNFVGVPLAALDSVVDFTANGGVNGDTYMMNSLLEASKAPTLYLLLAGLVMVLTLWCSKKAHRVLKTSLNLSSSQAGEQEQFGSSLPGRMIVRSSMTLGKIINQIIPSGIRSGIDSRFKPRKLQRGEVALPFDYVRASINLVLSSILIATATSLKLPLSTTYVTFMVAMGSSFADGAWDRESAVYRISGVLTVISGWFLTAFAACAMGGLVCTLINLGGNLMAVALMILVVTLLIRSNFINKSEEVQSDSLLKGRDCISVRDAINSVVGPNLTRTVELFSETISAFLNDNESSLRRLKVESSALFEQLSQGRRVYYTLEQDSENDPKLDRDARYMYYRAFSNMREVSRELQRLSTTTKEHIANRHRVFHGELKLNLLRLSQDLQKLTRGAEGRHALETLMLSTHEIISSIERMQNDLLRSISSEDISMRGCELYLSFLQLGREIVSRYTIVSVMQQELNELCDKKAQMDTQSDASKPHDDSSLEDRPASVHLSDRILHVLHLTKHDRQN